MPNQTPPVTIAIPKTRAISIKGIDENDWNRLLHAAQEGRITSASEIVRQGIKKALEELDAEEAIFRED